MFLPTSSLLCPGSYIITLFLHQACYAQAPTYLLWPGPNMLQPTSCLLCPGPYIITPSPTSSLLCSGSYNNPTIPKPLHMFYPTSACYAQAPTLPPQSYIKPVMCPGSYIKPTMLRIQHMLHPTLSLLCSSPYIHVARSGPSDMFPRASRLCSGSNDTKPNTHHKHPKIPSGIGSRHLTPPISPRWV